MRIGKKITRVFPIPNDPDKGEVTIVHLLPGEVEDLQEKMKAFETVMRRNDKGDLEPEMRQNSDLGNTRYLFVQAAVTDWKNFKFEKGEMMPCNEDTKLRVSREVEIEVTRKDGKTEILGFPAWVNECRIELGKIVRGNKEAAEKN